MKILSIDTSSKICGVALLEDQILIGCKELDNGRTHSENLMHLVQTLLEENHMPKESIDMIAVNIGPGSFTGIRIGVSSAKAMATALKIPLIGVNALESLAYNLIWSKQLEILYQNQKENFEQTKLLTNVKCVNEPIQLDLKCLEDHKICSVIDAKNNQVYYGIYDSHLNQIEIGASSIEECITKLKQESTVFLIGDGSCVHKMQMIESLQNCSLTFSDVNQQSAVSLGLVAFNKYQTNSQKETYEKMNEAVNPLYLRKSQAERMKEKQQDKNGSKIN